MALEAVQAPAGHASIESTRVYLHLANDWLATEYRRAAELIDGDEAAVAPMLAAHSAGARPPAPRPARQPGGAGQHRRRAVGADPGRRPAGGSDDRHRRRLA